MAYWLMKSEPAVYSIDDLRRDKITGWDSIRNYLARNNMRAMRQGDLAFFYQSNAEPSGIAGIMKIVGEAYPDPVQFDAKSGYFDPKSTKAAPRWDQVDVAFVKKFARVLSLAEIKAAPALKGMALLKLARLSVSPVTAKEWSWITRAGG